MTTTTETPEPLRTGVVLFWSDKGFGLIKPDWRGSAQVFFGRSSVVGWVPRRGDRVQYELAPAVTVRR